ncbi:hydantoinase/oxoprolinase family protein [Acuticoccus kandeliae]|uniref:hydantoinase/oxoprolinase family protein n=1 Tax=Acuticoccus kandeliae TaxID=2073160 RepID=UPI000D3EC677|nr:hydantoinase/oxoprolinase family protein [Acuticoccus kandeliae]
MSVKIGVDIGGTFTDFALIDDAAEVTRVHKILTSADDPSEAVARGISEIIAEAGLSLSDVDLISHGTTLVTNAVIERRGAKIGMIVTDGFADVIDMARETRYDLFNLRLKYAEPLVARRNRVEVKERTTSTGEIVAAPEEAAIVAAVRDLVARENITAIAICLLNSFANPRNESAIKEMIERNFPSLYISVSTEISNSIKEYERWTTTLVNAYTQPMIDAYIGRLEQTLGDGGFKGTLRIMTSSGGSFNGALARAMPVRLIESGPAAGILMAAKLAETNGLPQALAFDMGGTTAKGAFIRNGKPIKKYELEVAREHHFRPGSGLPVRVPVVDMIEIGSGGGSIAQVDHTGLVRVGPRSASSKPGPACYGLGGQSPTLTDAHLQVGFLDPSYFLGGEMELRPELSTNVVRETIGAALGIEDVDFAANGIREIACEDVAAAFRTHAAELGLDVRNSTLIAFGGSGPLVATSVARRLRIADILLPSGSGVLSAIGLLTSAASYETSRAYRVSLARLDDDAIADVLADLRADATAALVSMGVREADIVTEEMLDLRYVGQGHQVQIEVPARPADGNWADAIRKAFEASYTATFGISTPAAEVEITDWRVAATEDLPPLREQSVRPTKNNHAPRAGESTMWLNGSRLKCQVVNRYNCRPGDRIDGPALIQDAETTCVLLAGDVGTVTQRGDILIRVETLPAGEAATPDMASEAL